MARPNSAQLRQRGRWSRGERVGRLIMALSVPVGLAWMGLSLLAFRSGSVPALQRIVALHPWTAGLFFLPILILPGVITGAVMSSRSQRRSLAELIDAKGQLCLACRYPLTRSSLTAGLATGACPECGTITDPGSLKRGWCRTYPALAYEVDWPIPGPGSEAGRGVGVGVGGGGTVIEEESDRGRPQPHSGQTAPTAPPTSPVRS